MRTLLNILLQIVTVALMVVLIPFISNEILLALVYLVMVIIFFMIHKEKNELIIFITGLLVMTLSEYFFIKTGVETFTERGLLGVMPLWLPILWAYGFVAIKRAVLILNA